MARVAYTANRYEHAAPGDLLHLDIKRLVRIRRPSHRVTGDRRDGVKGIGAEFLHIAIDDPSRIAFTAMYPDQTERSSTHFLIAAVAWYEGLGIGIRRVLTDNGPCYKAHRFAHACRQLRLKHHRTRPYTPRTTATPNASSRPPSTSGLTPTPSRTQNTGRLRFPPGPTNTTGTDLTPVSTNFHPSAEQVSMTTTS